MKRAGGGGGGGGGGAGARAAVEVEKNLVNCRLKAVTAYFGRLAGAGHRPPPVPAGDAGGG